MKTYAYAAIAIAVLLVVAAELVIGWVRIVTSDQREARNYRTFLEVVKLQRQVRRLSKKTGVSLPQEFHDDAAS